MRKLLDFLCDPMVTVILVGLILARMASALSVEDKPSQLLCGPTQHKHFDKMQPWHR